jgi:hypothetical protein
MKVKLLKKLRKRYSWYINTDGDPVLINHRTRSVTLFDIKYCAELYKMSVEERRKTLEISEDIFKFRLLIECYTGVNFMERAYRYRTNIAKRLIRKNLKHRPTS